MRARRAACGVLSVALSLVSLPALAQAPPQRLPAPASLDWAQLAPTRNLSSGGLDAANGPPGPPTAASQRKLQLNGLAVKYQVTKSVAFEGGARLGLGASGAFIGLRKSFGRQ